MDLYIVLGTSLIVWMGLFFYMARVDAKVRDLESKE
jgi:CcmD family protein